MTVRNGGQPVAGTVRCAVKLARSAMRTSRGSSAADGRAGCDWIVPLGARGQRLRGSITERYQGATVSRAFATQVR